MSYTPTLSLKWVYTVSSTWGPKLSNNRCLLFTMLTKQNLLSALRRKCCKDKLSDHAKNLVFFLNNGLPIMWPAYLKISRKTPCFFSFSRNGPIIEWPAHPKILRKLHALLRNGLNIGWPAHLKIHLKILRKLHAFLRNGLNIGWPTHLKILRKLHALQRNGFNIRLSGDLRILKFLENSTLY